MKNSKWLTSAICVQIHFESQSSSLLVDQNIFEVILTTNFSIYFKDNIFISSLFILRSNMYAYLHLDLFKTFKSFNFYRMIEIFLTFTMY